MNAHPSAHPWVLTFKPNPGAALRLVCFAHSGGAAQVFRPWMTTLPPAVEVCGIQLPGRWSRIKEPLFRRMGPLVEAALPAVRSLFDRPIVFFGHSIGALIAFELARRLRPETPRLLRHVYVSGRFAPQLPPPFAPTYTFTDDQDFIRGLSERYEGIPQQILADEEQMKILLPVLRADMEMYETYTYEDHDGPLTCSLSALGGTQDKNVSRSGLEAWRQHTSGPFDVEQFDGGHFYLQSDPKPVLAKLCSELPRWF